MLLLLPRRGARRQSHRRGHLENGGAGRELPLLHADLHAQPDRVRLSPDQFAGDDFVTGARGTTYYFSSKSLLYGEENANLTYFGRWAPNCTSGGTNYDIYRGIRYCFYLLDNIYKVPAVSQENADRYVGEA